MLVIVSQEQVSVSALPTTAVHCCPTVTNSKLVCCIRSLVSATFKACPTAIGKYRSELTYCVWCI